jgi:hypothetical protein
MATRAKYAKEQPLAGARKLTRWEIPYNSLLMIWFSGIAGCLHMSMLLALRSDESRLIILLQPFRLPF